MCSTCPVARLDRGRAYARYERGFPVAAAHTQVRMSPRRKRTPDKPLLPGKERERFAQAHALRDFQPVHVVEQGLHSLTGA